MASGTRISFATAQDIGQAIRDALDAGSTNAVIEIRTGSPPATVEASSTGTLLATLLCGDPSFDAGADQDPNCLMTAYSISNDTSADTTGTAGYFVAGSSNSSGVIATKVIIGTCGEVGDSPDMVLDNADIVVGGTVAVTAWTIEISET